MSRWRASLIHLGISTLIAALVVSAMLLVWYPSPFFSAMGGTHLVTILVCVDVVLGPMITLIIFGPGKTLKALRFDFAVIGLVQLSALAYGVYVVAEARPVYMVFTVDRFDLVAANQIREEELAKVKRPEFAAIPLGSPRTVAVTSPTDANEQLRIIDSALGGADLQTFPQYYVPYEQLAQQAAKKAKPLAALRKQVPDASAEIDRAVAKAGKAESELAYLPVKGRARVYSVVLDAKSGAILGFAEVNPW
ncbi:hypothetical protein BWI17_19715 [Betaproteobacteria bacterium GR16-43]|nr:hypothetical protein BWI17_19715 [Betaproteobacteria bacterium GR16-43]